MFLVFKLSLMTTTAGEDLQETNFLKSFNSVEEAENYIASKVADLDLPGAIIKAEKKDDVWRIGEYSSDYETKEVYELDLNCESFKDIKENIEIFYVLKEM